MFSYLSRGIKVILGGSKTFPWVGPDIYSNLSKPAFVIFKEIDLLISLLSYFIVNILSSLVFVLVYYINEIL